MKTPSKDIIVGGYILVEGKPNIKVPEENSRKVSKGKTHTTVQTKAFPVILVSHPIQRDN